MADIHSFEPIWENWVIDEKLGEGQYGEVWKAHREDPFVHISQTAAVKHISIPLKDKAPEGMDSIPDETRKRYYRKMLDQLIVETEAMIRLRGKPNIVSYEEHKVVPKENEEGYDIFLRMELLTSLRKYIDEKKSAGGRPMARDEVIRLGVDLSTALETLENQKLIHRDIKPDNTFVDADGHFKLGDFGTARVLENMKRADTVVGSPMYMAPEVYGGISSYDQTVDIYSLGIMLYRYMNNGYFPFMGPSRFDMDQALTRRMEGEKVEQPCNADSRLAGVILKACAFKPEERYQTAKELKKALLKCAEAGQTAVPVICVLENGMEIYREIQHYDPDQEVSIRVPAGCNPPDGYALRASSIRIRIDRDGTAHPPEAKFVYEDPGTVLFTSVKVVCLDEEGRGILTKTMPCSRGHSNTIPAPEIAGYKLIGSQKKRIQVSANPFLEPDPVEFSYVRLKETPVDIPVLCVLEDGSELMRTVRQCKPGEDNRIRAPELNGYVLAGQETEKIRIGANGKPTPERVVFSYKKEITNFNIPVLCRDGKGEEIHRESRVCPAGETTAIRAPEVERYVLADPEANEIRVSVDRDGKTTPAEVAFVYKKKGGSKKIVLLASAVLAVIALGFGITTLTRPRTTLCVNCGQEVSVNDPYCDRCGTELGHWKCYNCGELWPAASLYCEHCGIGKHAPGVTSSPTKAP